MSAATQNLGKVLIAVTEDRFRLILEFEGGVTFSVEATAPDGALKLTPYDSKRGTAAAKAIESGEV